MLKVLFMILGLVTAPAKILFYLTFSFIKLPLPESWKQLLAFGLWVRHKGGRAPTINTKRVLYLFNHTSAHDAAVVAPIFNSISIVAAEPHLTYLRVRAVLNSPVNLLSASGTDPETGKDNDNLRVANTAKIFRRIVTSGESLAVAPEGYVKRVQDQAKLLQFHETLVDLALSRGYRVVCISLKYCGPFAWVHDTLVYGKIFPKNIRPIAALFATFFLVRISHSAEFSTKKDVYDWFEGCGYKFSEVKVFHKNVPKGYFISPF